MSQHPQLKHCLPIPLRSAHGRTLPGCRRWLRLQLCALALVALAACGGGEGGQVAIGSGQGADPVVLDFPVFYVKRPVPDPLDPPSDARELRTFNIGADLFMRDRASPTATEQNLTATLTAGLGDVSDVDVSYDGKKVVFAMRARFIENADEEDQPTWNIWEYDITSAALRRVIASDTTAEEGHDRFPHYLPDGRIIFASTRQRQSKAILLDEGKPQYSGQDENDNEPAYVLHVMNADGSDIHQVSYNQSHDFDAAVMADGKVVFSRWEGAAGGDRISLYSMNPDGTALELLYGSQARTHATGTDDSVIQFMSPRPMQNGRLLSVIRPFSDTDEGGDLIAIDTANYVENTQPTLPNAGVLSGPAQTRITVTDVRTIPGPSPGGRYRSAFPLWDGTNRALVSWSQCRLTLNARIVPCTPSNLGDPAALPAAPLYGIYIYDVGQNTQAPIVTPTEGIIYSDVVAAAVRSIPAVILDKTIGVDLDANLAGQGVGILHIKSVYDIDGIDRATGGINAIRNPLTTPAAPRQAQFLRLEKPVSIPDEETLDPDLLDQAFGPNRGLGLKDILGYVPIEPDGSVKAKVPANVAFTFSVVDGNGRRINLGAGAGQSVNARHQSWLQLRPGEVVTCGGCHAPSTTTPRSHGRSNLFPMVNAGAPANGLFPGTDTVLQGNPGETMAETRGRIMCPISSALGGACSPSVNLVFNDLWTAPAPSKVASFDRCYAAATTDVRNNPADLTSRHLCVSRLDTPAPVATQCNQTWDSLCRITVNYVPHLQPVWSKPRITLAVDGVTVLSDNTCTSCHAPTNAMAQAQVPAAQLDLTGGPSADNPDQLNSYRELLFGDNEQEVVGGVLVDRTVIVINPTTLLPEVQFFPVAASMSAGNARGSRFFTVFSAGGSHAGRLTEGELRLVSEWVDIGAQYYNDPFAVPVN